ncbi:MAG: NUDIX domain-containing protein [Patescibacteria group bacterium]|nr:NUDIX domain-containing protein [Patescibacteria group bacterium]
MIRTVDAAIIVDRRFLLLIRRAKPPFEDRLVLPGGHVDEDDETLADAIAREIREEVGLDISPAAFRPLMILDAPNRDPRPGRRVSTVFIAEITAEVASAARADSDAAEVVIRDLSSLAPEEIGFDHFLAIAALRRARGV